MTEDRVYIDIEVLPRRSDETSCGVEKIEIIHWDFTTICKMRTVGGIEAIGSYTAHPGNNDVNVRSALARANALRRLEDLAERFAHKHRK